MISLAVARRDELAHGSSKMPFTNRNDPVEIFFRYRPHEALCVCIRIRGLMGAPPVRPPLRAVPTPRRSTSYPDRKSTRDRWAIRHRERPHHLTHKCFVRLWRGAQHLHPPGREINHEHRVERHEAARRPYLGREEVGSGDRAPMRAQKRLPRRRAVRCGKQTAGLHNPRDRRASDLPPQVPAP